MRILLSIIIIGLSLNVFSQTKPKADEAIVNVLFTTLEDVIRPHEIVIFTNTETKQEYVDTTGTDGKFTIFLPKGKKYHVTYTSFTDTVEYKDIELPNFDGTFTLDYTLKYSVYKSQKTIVLKNVFFDTNKSTLRKESYKTLDHLVYVLNTKKTMKIEIGGHTDSDGNDESNLKLSNDRANTVKNYLIKKGIDKSRLEAKGYGETKPIASNETEEGKQQNRRTEVVIISE